MTDVTDELQSPIKCRALISSRCYNGRQFPAALDPWEDDGTFERQTGTIVCDPCYIAIGHPPQPLVADGIRRARAARAEMEDRQGKPPGAGMWPGRDDGE